jgi:hypothetical protein
VLFSSVIVFVGIEGMPLPDGVQLLPPFVVLKT